MRAKTLTTLLLLLALAGTLVGCGGSGTGTTGTTPPPTGGGTTGEAASGGSTTVVEDGFAFEPATLQVNVGDTVTFRNDDSAPHIVKIDGKELGNQDPGASVTWTAEKAGTYPYVCTIHPAMTGEIVVK